MKKTRALMLAIAVTVLTLGVVAAPTYAVENNTDTTTSPNGTTSTTQNTETEHDGGASTQPPAERQRQVKTHETEMRTQGQNILKEVEKEKEAKDKANEADKKSAETAAAERQKRCEEHREGLQTKVERIVENAKAYKERVDEVYSKALEYQKANNVSIDAALVAAANAAQAQAAVSVQALSGLKPTVDCSNTSVATDVATFKAAAAQARNDLQAYRLAVKNVLTALEAAKQ